MTEIIGDMLSNPTFDPKAIDAEKSTILREAEAVAKDKSETLFDHLHAVAFQGAWGQSPLLADLLSFCVSLTSLLPLTLHVHDCFWDLQDSPSVTTSSDRPLTSCR